MTDVVQIPLANGRGVALIDAADLPLVGAYRWFLSTKLYAVANRPGPGRGQLWMHRLILAPPDGTQVDHVNGDKLDNRRANLRPATNRQNHGNAGLRADNSSGYKGVIWDAARGRWRAEIKDHGRCRFLGRYGTVVEAAQAYDRAALEVFGEFARPNFPEVS